MLEWAKRLKEMSWKHNFPEEKITVTIDLHELTATIEETRQVIDDVMELYKTYYKYIDSCFQAVELKIKRLSDELKYVKDHYKYYEGKDGRTILNLYQNELNKIKKTRE